MTQDPLLIPFLSSFAPFFKINDLKAFFTAFFGAYFEEGANSEAAPPPPLNSRSVVNGPPLTPVSSPHGAALP
jgi:hypothetical protein